MWILRTNNAIYTLLILFCVVVAIAPRHGLTLSHLLLEHFVMPWEIDIDQMTRGISQLQTENLRRRLFQSQALFNGYLQDPMNCIPVS